MKLFHRFVALLLILTIIIHPQWTMSDEQCTARRFAMRPSLFASQALASQKVSGFGGVQKLNKVAAEIGEAATQAGDYHQRPGPDLEKILTQLSKNTAGNVGDFVHHLENLTARLIGSSPGLAADFPFPTPDIRVLGDEELPSAGRIISRIAAGRSDRTPMGHIFPYLMLVLDKYEPDSNRFARAEPKIRLLVRDGEPEERLVALFAEGVLLARHLRPNGMHFLKDNDRPVDNNALVAVVQEYLGLLLKVHETDSALWNKIMPTTPGHENIQIRFGDFMLWGLADTLDIRLHDPSVLMTSHDVSRAEELFGTPEGTIRDYLAQALAGLDYRPQTIGALLQKTFKSDREWRSLGFRLPGSEGDLNPPGFFHQIRKVLLDESRPMQDAILNVALADALYDRILSDPANPMYAERHGRASDFLHKVLREWEPFHGAGYLREKDLEKFSFRSVWAISLVLSMVLALQACVHHLPRNRPPTPAASAQSQRDYDKIRRVLGQHFFNRTLTAKELPDKQIDKYLKQLKPWGPVIFEDNTQRYRDFTPEDRADFDYGAQLINRPAWEAWRKKHGFDLLFPLDPEGPSKPDRPITKWLILLSPALLAAVNGTLRSGTRGLHLLDNVASWKKGFVLYKRIQYALLVHGYAEQMVDWVLDVGEFVHQGYSLEIAVSSAGIPQNKRLWFINEWQTIIPVVLKPIWKKPLRWEPGELERIAKLTVHRQEEDEKANEEQLEKVPHAVSLDPHPLTTPEEIPTPPTPQPEPIAPKKTEPRAVAPPEVLTYKDFFQSVWSATQDPKLGEILSEAFAEAAASTQLFVYPRIGPSSALLSSRMTESEWGRVSRLMIGEIVAIGQPSFIMVAAGKRIFQGLPHDFFSLGDPGFIFDQKEAASLLSGRPPGRHPKWRKLLQTLGKIRALLDSRGGFLQFMPSRELRFVVHFHEQTPSKYDPLKRGA